MEIENLIVGSWYSAHYQSGFSIIFQVTEIIKSSISLCRKDGTVINSIPSGYTQILLHGTDEPEYQEV